MKETILQAILDTAKELHIATGGEIKVTESKKVCMCVEGVINLAYLKSQGMLEELSKHEPIGQYHALMAKLYQKDPQRCGFLPFEVAEWLDWPVIDSSQEPFYGDDALYNTFDVEFVALNKEAYADNLDKLEEFLRVANVRFTTKG